MSFIRKIKKKDGQTYLAEVENTWVDGKCVQKHIRYIGKEVDGEAVISVSSKDLQVEGVKVYGPLLAVHRIAEKIGLPEILGEHSNEVLSMVYAHCLDYKSVRKMPAWYKRTDLNLLLNLERLTEGRLLSAMDGLTEGFMEDIQRKVFKNTKKLYKIDTKGTVYDVTNTYFHGKNCDLGKKGWSKDGKRDCDLVQIALATTQKEGVPIFHKTFRGNIHDSRTLVDVSESLSRYGMGSGMFVFDRGITSEKKLISLGKMGLNVLCGMPLKSSQKITVVKKLKKEKVDHISNMVALGESNFYAKSIPYKFGSVKGRLTVCYNEVKRTEVMESRRRRILEAQKMLKEGEAIDGWAVQYLTATGRIRHSVLEEEEITDGFSFIFCTKNIPIKETVRLYFEKDIVEKAFKSLKGVSNLRPVRFWLKERVKAHVFICYLSHLLLSLLKIGLDRKDLGISPIEAIEELETMFNVYFVDKKKKMKFIRTVALSKLQEKILRSVDPKILKKDIVSMQKS